MGLPHLLVLAAGYRWLPGHLWKLSKFSEAATVVVRSFSMLKLFLVGCNWSACAHCWRRCRTWARNLCEDVVRPDGQTAFLLAKWHRCTPDSSQRSWSGCRLVRRGTKRWEGVRYAEKCSVKHSVRWDDFWVRKETTQLLWTSWALSHTHVRVKVKCAQTCATRQDWEKCACDKVFCLHGQGKAYDGVDWPCRVKRSVWSRDSPWRSHFTFGGAVRQEVRSIQRALTVCTIHEAVAGESLAKVSPSDWCVHHLEGWWWQRIKVVLPTRVWSKTINDKDMTHTQFINQCQKLTPGSQTQLSSFVFSFRLFQFCPPCFGFSFLHASKPSSSSFRRPFQWASSCHHFACFSSSWSFQHLPGFPHSSFCFFWFWSSCSSPVLHLHPSKSAKIIDADSTMVEILEVVEIIFGPMQVGSVVASRQVCVVDQLSETSLLESGHRESLLESLPTSCDHVTREELIKARNLHQWVCLGKKWSMFRVGNIGSWVLQWGYQRGRRRSGVQNSEASSVDLPDFRVLGRHHGEG